MPTATPSQAIYINELDPITTMANSNLLHYQTSGGADKYIELEDFRDELNKWERDNASAVGVTAAQTYGELTDTTAGSEDGRYSISVMTNGTLREHVRVSGYAGTSPAIEIGEVSIGDTGTTRVVNLKTGVIGLQGSIPRIYGYDSDATAGSRSIVIGLDIGEFRVSTLSDDMATLLGFPFKIGRGYTTSTSIPAVEIGAITVGTVTTSMNVQNYIGVSGATSGIYLNRTGASEILFMAVSNDGLYIGNDGGAITENCIFRSGRLGIGNGNNTPGGALDVYHSGSRMFLVGASTGADVQVNGSFSFGDLMGENLDSVEAQSIGANSTINIASISVSATGDFESFILILNAGDGSSGVFHCSLSGSSGGNGVTLISQSGTSMGDTSGSSDYNVYYILISSVRYIRIQNNTGSAVNFSYTFIRQKGSN